MYNETIFEQLKEIYIQTFEHRKNDLKLTKEKALELIQDKYKITAITQLSDKIKLKINNLVYYDCKIELKENNEAQNKNKINSYQAMLDRQNNKCFCNFDLRVLSHHFYLLYEIFNEDILYRNVLQNLTAYLCNEDYFCLNKVSLDEIFNCAIDLYLLKGNIFVDNEQSKAVKAIKYFNLEHNKDYNIKMNRIELSDVTYEKIHQIIEGKIETLGSFKTLSLLFNLLEKTINKDFNRYMIFRNRNGLGNANTPLPYQYIIHIACKYLSDYRIDNISNVDIDLFIDIINAATLFSDLLEIFEENPYAEIMASTDSLPYIIKNNILLESLCFPIQHAPQYILELLQNLYLTTASKVSNIPNLYTYTSFIKFVKFVLLQKPCSIIDATSLSESLRIKKDTASKYLDYFSQDCASINSNYNEAFKKTTLYDKPIIKLNDNEYLCLCNQFCGYSFLKILYDDMKKYYNGSDKNNLNKKFGKEIENWIYELFNKKQFKYQKGIYAPKSQEQGECDLILEDEKRTVFIEIKNRGIAKEYEYGDDVKVLDTLGCSSLLAQKQILKHKLYLLKHNQKTNLYESENTINPTCELDVNNKQIYAVSLCGAELLFFTSGFISEHLITVLPNINFSTSDGNNDKLNNINKVANDISVLVNEYLKIVPTITLRDIFHLSTVKSVQQLWFILKYSKNIEELIDNLTFDTHMQNYSGDFYFNFIQHLNLQQHRKDTK